MRLALLALLLTPMAVVAQTDRILSDAILFDAMNGALEMPPLRYTLATEGCTGFAVLDQDYDSGIHQQTTTRFDMAAIVPERHGLTDFSPALPLGELSLPLADGSMAGIEIVLTQVPEDQTGTFLDQGFACDGGTCTRTLEEAEVKLPFGGPDPASRSLIILSRLGEIAAGCAAQ